jgi:hypothetical protein
LHQAVITIPFQGVRDAGSTVYHKFASYSKIISFTAPLEKANTDCSNIQSTQKAEIGANPQNLLLLVAAKSCYNRELPVPEGWWAIPES